MYKHGSLLALFCFRRMCKTVRDKNRFVDHHTQYGMETFKGHYFFVRSNEPIRDACIHNWRLPHQRAALL